MSRTSSRLADLPTGTKFRLYAKYRDGSPRPRFRWSDRSINGDTLTVVRVEGESVRVSTGKYELPLWGELRVML